MVRPPAFETAPADSAARAAVAASPAGAIWAAARNTDTVVAAEPTAYPRRWKKRVSLSRALPIRFRAASSLTPSRAATSRWLRFSQ